MTTTAKQLRVNGTEIHYLEAGEGVPLVLLQAGLMSTDPVWEGHPSSYLSHLGRFAARFRVIVPDARGCGRTPNPGRAAVGYSDLADDLLALSSALQLDRPLACGFSDGGLIATVAAIKAPTAFRAVVNSAGFDLLNPNSRAFAMARKVFGGHPEATAPNAEACEAFFTAAGPAMNDFLRRLRSDHRAQMPDGWKTALSQSFDRMTTPPGVTLEDLETIEVPMLVQTGDRDMFCPPEDAVAVYRASRAGELAISPGLGHELSTASVDTSLDFLQRHAV